MASGRGLIVAIASALASSTLAAWYLVAGNQFVATAYTRGTRAVLRNILAGEGPFTLADYLAASDALVWGAVVLGWLLAAVLFAGRYADPVMARVYRATLAASDWAVGHSRIVGAVAAIVVVGGLAWVAVDVLQRFPNSGDDHWFPAGWFSRALEITGDHLVNVVQWTPPGLLALYGWYWVSAPGKSRRRFTDFIFPALVLGYFIYVNRGGNRYGPRYYFEAFPFVVLAVTARVMRQDRYEDKSAADRWAFYLMAASVAACLPMLAWHARTESRVVAERREPYRLVAEHRIDRAIVFVAGPTGWARPMNERDLTRNDPDFADAVLYAHDRRPENDRLMAAYPERSYWRYSFDRRTRQGTLEPLRPMVR